MELFLGRYLGSNEHIHHINRNKLDNRIENLRLVSNSEHFSIHRSNSHIDTSDRSCNQCGSHETLLEKPKDRYKTPYPKWYHLPHDKENWYCKKCYLRFNYLRGTLMLKA